MNEILLEGLNVMVRVGGAIAGIGLGLFVCWILFCLALRFGDSVF